MLVNRHLDEGDDAEQVFGKESDKAPPQGNPAISLHGTDAKTHQVLAERRAQAIADRFIDQEKQDRPAG